MTPRFRLDDNNMIYARVGSGYRPGGPNSVTPVESAAGVPTSYKPDKLTDYDLGYKASLFERKLTLDLSAFYINWRDIQIETEYSGQTTSGNGGTARSDGLEASVVLAPLHGLNIALNLTYTDAHLTEDAPGVNGKDGDELPNVPKWSASLECGSGFCPDRHDLGLRRWRGALRRAARVRVRYRLPGRLRSGPLCRPTRLWT